MSDGMDPSHGPYKGNRGVDLDAWCEEFVLRLSKNGLLDSSRPSTGIRILDETRTFATSVIRAARDGHFSKVR